MADQQNNGLDTLVELIGVLEYGDRIPAAAIDLAKQIGAAIIYGYSDDGITVEGVVRDGGSAFRGNTLFLDREGFMPINEDLILQDDGPRTVEECRKIVNRFDSAIMVRAIWQDSGVSWSYQVELDHRNFGIKEDGDIWCNGIVLLLPDSTEKEEGS